MGLTRAVVVTGTSSGIGRACALDLARRGFTVHATVRRPEDARALESDAGALFVKTHLLDVTDEGGVRALARRVAEEMGDAGVSGLVNSAGSRCRGRWSCFPFTCCDASSM